jgi:putative monooxygenase
LRVAFDSSPAERDVQQGRTTVAGEIKEPAVKSVDDMPADKRRGGDVRTLLSPKTCGTTTGFMGVATLAAGDKISEHFHPYSEEFIYVVKGTITADLDGKPTEVKAKQGLFIPIFVKHRLRNTGTEEAFIVFNLAPLAPNPKWGHVDTE